MYTPQHFDVTDKAELFSFIEANGFGQLVSTVAGRIVSTHIPFLLSADRTHLLAHVARQNPQHGEIEDQEVLVSLQGPHDYVSPSWYSSPGVPTWNYQAVHIYGECKVFTDTERLQVLVENLTAQYEKTMTVPWQPAYNPSMLGAIVGLEISIRELQGKFKLSQNRSLADQQAVAQQLEQRGAVALATAMRRLQ